MLSELAEYYVSRGELAALVSFGIPEDAENWTEHKAEAHHCQVIFYLEIIKQIQPVDFLPKPDANYSSGPIIWTARINVRDE